MSQLRALITGVNGQDGSYLVEQLLDKGYEVFGLMRNIESNGQKDRLQRLLPVINRISLIQVALESYKAISDVVAAIQPDECYHLAASSFVSYDFEDERSTLASNIIGTHHVLAAMKDLAPRSRFYFAGTSEMFGSATELPQNEQTRFRPRSVYGISKLAGFELVRNYRERYGLHASSGILFNHESPRRGNAFVTRKITSGVARILAGQATEIRLGNLCAERDWGYAREYVDAMWRMLQQPSPDDYVIATGRLHSVQTFVEMSFERAGLDWQKYVVSDPKFFRDREAVALCGDATKARLNLGWRPQKEFREMVWEMVEEDCHALGITLPAVTEQQPRVMAHLAPRGADIVGGHR